MREAVLRRIIKTRTNNAFGFAISPHRFRHAAVTYLATTHPEWISFGPDLLGHSDTAVAEAHYNMHRPKVRRRKYKFTLSMRRSPFMRDPRGRDRHVRLNENRGVLRVNLI